MDVNYAAIPVRLAGTGRSSVNDMLRYAAMEFASRLLLLVHPASRVDAGDESLRGDLFAAGGAIDLPCEPELLDRAP